MLRQKEILLFPKKTHAPRSLDSVKDRVAACVFSASSSKRRKGAFFSVSCLRSIKSTKQNHFALFEEVVFWLPVLPVVFVPVLLSFVVFFVVSFESVPFEPDSCAADFCAEPVPADFPVIPVKGSVAVLIPSAVSCRVEAA